MPVKYDSIKPVEELDQIKEEVVSTGQLIECSSNSRGLGRKLLYGALVVFAAVYFSSCTTYVRKNVPLAEPISEAASEAFKDLGFFSSEDCNNRTNNK